MNQSILPFLYFFFLLFCDLQSRCWILTFEAKDAMIQAKPQTRVELLPSKWMEWKDHVAIVDTMLLFWMPEQVYTSHLLKTSALFPIETMKTYRCFSKWCCNGRFAFLQISKLEVHISAVVSFFFFFLQRMMIKWIRYLFTLRPVAHPFLHN